MHCQFCKAEIEAPRETMCEKCEAEWNKGAEVADATWWMNAEEYRQWLRDR